MYSLTIQGAHASSYRFKSNSGQEFRSFVESLTLNATTLICSTYRTDLLYLGEEDHQEEIMKAWCKLVGKSISPEVRRRFIRAKGEKNTLESYFISLIYLARMPSWFNNYSKQLNLTIDQEPKHIIHKKIVGCAMHLKSLNQSPFHPFINDDYNHVTHFLLKNTRSFAVEATKNYLSN